MKRIILQEHGQSVVVIALMMVGLIAMMGLIFDGGNAYYQRRRMQNVSDAGALAGGRQLALALAQGPQGHTYAQEIAVRDAINSYATSNGGNTDLLNAWFVDENNRPVGLGPIGDNRQIPTNATGVSVTISTQFPTFFLGILSITTGDVGANTIVLTGAPIPNNLWPMTVQTQTLTSGPPAPNQCQFGVSNPPPCQIWGDRTGPGSLQWQSFNVCDTSAKYMKDVLAGTESSGIVRVGDSICTSTGTMDTAKAYFPSWLNEPVTIPIYDCTNADPSCPNYSSQHSGSNLKYHVVAFAKFNLLGFYMGNGNGQSGGDTSCGAQSNQYVCGKFIEWADPEAIDPNGKCNYGYCAFQMWQ